MEGIGEAIEFIANLAKGTVKTDILQTQLERTGVYYVVGPDGKAVKAIAEPNWHAEKLDTPAELVRFVEAHKAKGSAVFYDENAVTFVYDLQDRRNVARCELIPSPQYKWLSKPTAQLRQADFVRLLRIDLRGCLPADSNLLGVVRNLRFNAEREAAGNIQHGRESISRSIQAAVTGESAIPEEVRLLIPVFENHSYTVQVTCAIEVFPQEQLLKITPYPLEVHSAMDETLANIAETFAGDGMPPVYRGRP